MSFKIISDSGKNDGTVTATKEAKSTSSAQPIAGGNDGPFNPHSKPGERIPVHTIPTAKPVGAPIETPFSDESDYDLDAMRQSPTRSGLPSKGKKK